MSGRECRDLKVSCVWCAYCRLANGDLKVSCVQYAYYRLAYGNLKVSCVQYAYCRLAYGDLKVSLRFFKSLLPGLAAVPVGPKAA